MTPPWILQDCCFLSRRSFSGVLAEVDLFSFALIFVSIVLSSLGFAGLVPALSVSLPALEVTDKDKLTVDYAEVIADAQDAAGLNSGKNAHHGKKQSRMSNDEGMTKLE